VTDRDLLWVESVSERLLGTSAPRAWERAFFQTDDEDDRLDAPTAPPAAPVAPAPPEQPYAPAPERASKPEYIPGVPDAPAREHVRAPLRYTDEPVDSPSYPGPGASYETAARYFSEGDADWRHDLGPEFPDDGEDEAGPGDAAVDDADESADELGDEDTEADLVIDLTQPVRPEPPDAGRGGSDVDDEILRLALVSGDTVLATAVLRLLEDRARDRQRIATLVTTLGALVEVVDRIGAPDHELAVTARLLRRVVGR
jgi:hypothetical protein